MKTVARNKREALDWLVDQVPPWLDKPYTVSVEPFKRPRTNPQNAKIHAMIRDLALHTGYTEAMMKEIVKAQFAPLRAVVLNGKEVSIPKGTSDMTVDECGDFIERLYELGAELSCGFTSEG